MYPPSDNFFKKILLLFRAKTTSSDSFQVALSNRQGVGRQQFLGVPGHLQRRRIRSGSRSDVGRDETDPEGTSGRTLDRTRNKICLRRLHRLQRQRQPLLCRQVKKLDFQIDEVYSNNCLV